MSSQLLEDLKQRTSVAENTLKTLEQNFNHLKLELAKKKEESKEDENKTPFHRFLDNTITLSLKNGSFNYLLHNGFFYPNIISKRGLEWCESNFEPNEHDIFVQTFPKTGTTLALQIVYNILTKSGIKVLGARPDKFPSAMYSFMWLDFKSSQDLYKHGNNNEITKHLQNNNENTIRLWKTHSNLTCLPCKNKKYTGKCKIIHVSRNPKDVIQSGYHFFDDATYSGDLNSYFNFFVNGFVESNNYFTFEMDTIKMIKKYGKDKILFVYFEDLIINPMSEIRKIIQFLGVKNLNQNDVKDVMHLTSFKKQKELENKNKASILRKGKIGTWKNELCKEQSNIIDRIIKDRIEVFNKDLEDSMKIKWNFG